MIIENEFPDFEKLDRDTLRNAIYNAETGMVDDVFTFVASVTPMVNVDLLIRDKEGRVLLAWRDDGHNYGWHIPGGIVRFKETFEERIQKTAVTELGTKVSFDREPVKISEIFMPYQRRGHFISFLYRCEVDEGYVLNNQVLENTSGFLKWHSEMPELLVEGQMCYYEYLKTIFERTMSDV